MLERVIAARKSKGKGREVDEEDAEERKMAVTAIVAMIEIWMSDLWCVYPLKGSERDGADTSLQSRRSSSEQLRFPHCPRNVNTS